MKITVAVATHDRADLLARLLDALAGQTLSPSEFEIVVALDGCTDRSRDVCSAFQARLPNLRVLEITKPGGQARALQTVLTTARGAQIAFTDDDCVPERGWLERLSAALDQHELVAGAVRSPTRPFLLFCHNIAQCHAYFPDRRGPPTTFAAGTNFGCRRTLLNAIGGLDLGNGARSFAPDMTVTLQSLRRGVRCHFAADAAVWHLHDRRALGELLRYSASHASRSILLRREFADVLHTPLVLRSPLLLALTSPVIALQVTGQIYVRNPGLRRHLHTAPIVFLVKMAWCWGAVRGLLGR